MNSAIEILNHWGGSFLEFARAMFWQSSVLVLVLLALDFGLRRRVRAAVRHGLWLVLLLKLVLPTDLALPTSPAWWWSRATAVPVIEAPVVAHNYVATQEEVLTPDISAADWVEAAPAPVRPALTLAAGSLLLAGVVSLGLLGWLVRRWRQVVRASRQALPDAALALRLGEARELTRLRSTVPVKLTRDTMSPAVCGLFRPVILLPSALAETLAPEQLRAVLLHELMHVRRGDVWVNLAQSLLQIVYWWHPLVWLANARIRRVREEAVDEAVMVALRGEAEIYAPTLLAVAKFALHRPVASLGLVGILESRSALRQRIERLVTLPVPSRAGLGVLGALGIVAFSAVALPMGEAPPLPPQPAPEVGAASTEKTPWPDPRFEGYRNVNLLAHFLILDQAQLLHGVPALANAQSPCLIPALEVDGLITQLRKAEARFYNDFPGGFRQGAMSGAHFRFLVGGVTNAMSTLVWETTNSPGHNIVSGCETRLPATQPDWTPMDLNLQPWLADTGTRCQLELTLGGQVQTAQPAEVVIPSGGALAWAVPTPAHPGKCQVMLVMSWDATNQTAEGPLVTQTFPVQVAKLQAAWQVRGWPTNDDQDPESMVYDFIYDAGLNWLPPRTISYTNNLLEVQAPAGDVAVIQTLVTEINQFRPAMAPDNALATATPAKPRPLVSYILSAETGLPHLRQQTGLTADSPAADYLTAFNKLLGAGGQALPTNSLWLGDQGVLLVRGEPAEMNAVGQLFRDLNGPARPAGSRWDSDNQPEPAASMVYASRNGPAAETNLFMRTFRINTNLFYTAVQKALGTNVPIAPKALAGSLRDLFGRFGVDLAKPKALFFNDRLGLLFVKATGEDLTIIERVLESLNQPAVTNSAVTPEDQTRTQPVEKQWVLPKNPPPSANAGAATNLIYTGPGRQQILSKLNSIHLGTNSFEHVPLSEVLRQLSKQAKMLDPEKQGVNFLINPQADSMTGVDPATGLPPTNQVDVGATMINIHLTDIRLADALDALVLVADRPIQYSIQDFGVVFSPKLPQAANLNWRVFKISMDTLKLGLGLAGPIDTPAGKSPTEAVLERLREYLSHRGVNLDPPKALNYNDSRGTLAVKASESDLDAVEQLIESWHKVAVPPSHPDLHAVDKQVDSWSTPAPAPNGPTNQAASTVTATNAPDVNQLMIDAMALYESGHGDEARVKLAQVLRIDPANPAALYYWRLVHTRVPTAAETNLFMRTFKVSPGMLESALAFPGETNFVINAVPADQLVLRLQNYFHLMGVNLFPPKSVFYNDRLGLLFVRATATDLDKIERAMWNLLNVNGSLVGINWHSFSNNPSPPSWLPTNPAPATITGILSNPNFQVAVNALKQRSGVENLKEPAVTTTSGRQTRARGSIMAENQIEPPFHLDLPAVPAPTNARPANVSRPNLLTQAYQFDRLIFSSGLQKALGLNAPVPSVEVTNALLTLFSRAGVTLAVPESIDFNEQRGALLVKATPEDQKTIAEVLGKLQVTIRPQVHIKARFIEVTGDITNPPALAHPPSGPNETTIVDGNLVRPWLHDLEQRPGTTILAEPEVTTTTGRQTQMRSTTMLSVVAGVNPKALTPPGLTRAEVKTNGFGFFVVTNAEFGPIFDGVPQVMADGYTINVRILAMANEFAGYDQPTHHVRVYADDMGANDPPATTTPPAPHINDRQFRASVNLYDGQALILTQPIDPRTGLPFEKMGRKAKHLLVVMSVNIVDAAGNRVHLDDDLPFAHDRVPPPPLEPGTPLDDRPFNIRPTMPMRP